MVTENIGLSNEKFVNVVVIFTKPHAQILLVWYKFEIEFPIFVIYYGQSEKKK